ncbi:MAG: rod shape-determining protein RodA [Chitinophagaceae bacterium]
MQENIINQKKGYNWTVLLLMLIMMSIGLVLLYAIEYNPKITFWNAFFSLHTLIGKQAFWIGISLILFILIQIIDVRVFTYFAFYFYIVGIFILILTLFISSDIRGSRSFISLGRISIQPAELFKTFAIIGLAKFLSNYNLNNGINRIKSWFIILLPFFIVLAQSELGQALVYMSLIIPLYREGFTVWIFGFIFLILLLFILTIYIHPTIYIIGAVSIGMLFFVFLYRKRKKKKLYPLIWVIGCLLFVISLQQIVFPFTVNNVLKSYHIKRIYATCGPDSLQSHHTYWMNTKTLEATKNAKKINYNVTQSKIAIGSGELTGQEYLHGMQTLLKFVPEQKNDFIFSSLGENFGFIGCFVYILFVITLLMQIINIAENQRSQLSRAYAYGVFAILFFHIVINISVAIGLFPVVGITLPWISYGGTSVLSFTIMIAILLKLDRYKKAAVK